MSPFCARDKKFRDAIADHIYPEDKTSLYELRRSWAVPLGPTTHPYEISFRIQLRKYLDSLPRPIEANGGQRSLTIYQ
jgi:hypothetical protein